MYDVYINRYKRNGTFVSGWRNICSIPSNNDNGFEISSPSVKCSEDNADSFDFSIEMNSQYYDSLIPLKTLVRVKYGDDVIFYGRVLTIDNSSIYQTRRVHCEGAFAFFNDTYYEGIQEADKQKIDFSTYYRRIISNHNSKLLDQYSQKVINRGYITVDGTTTFVPTTEERKYEPSSWTQTSSLLSSLTREFGGHMLVHYRSSGLYLDWYKYYSRDLGVNRPLVSVGENIIDINTSASNIDKIFSYVTPIGDTGSNGKPVYLDGYTYIDKNGTSHTIGSKSIPVSIVRDVYTDEQLTDEFHSASDYSSAVNNYGVIYKTQTFASAKTQEQLWNYTIKWIKDCYFGIASSFTIRAYDMHILDQTKSRILVGDCVNVQYIIMENGVKTTKTKKLVCKAVSYDLFNPDNNSYTFGIPSEVLNRSYSEGRGKSGSEQAGGGGSGGGSGEEKDIELTFDGIAKWIQAAGGKSTIYGGNIAAQSFIDNGEVTGTAKVYDPESLPEGETIDQHKDLIFNATIAGRITATGRNIYVATNPTMGCFAFIGGRPTNLSGALPITFWYLRTGKKQSLNYTPPSLMYTEEEEQLINIMANWDINVSSKDELNNVVNNFWIGLGDKAKGLKTQIWDPIQEKFVQPFKMAFEKAGSTIFGFLGLSGPNSKIRVSDDQTEDGSDGAELESDTFTFGTFLENWLHPKVQLDGGNSQVKAGFDEQGNWKSVMNASITWTDEHGQQHTTDGFVKAMDFAVPEVPSFKTKFIAVDQLVANKATIEELNVQKARIDSLETNTIKTGELKTKIAQITSGLVVNCGMSISGAIQSRAPIYASGYYIGTPDGSKNLSYALAGGDVKDLGNNEYEIVGYDFTGREISFGTFKKAGGGGISSVVWGWSAGKARATIYFTEGGSQVEMSPELDDIVLNGDPVWADNKKSFTQKFNVLDEFGSIAYAHPYSLTFPTLESYNAGRDAGWARSLQDCEFPDLGTDAKINVKLPNADEVAGTPRLREYTLSVDDNYAYLKRTDSGMSATAARIVNPTYQKGKKDGWARALQDCEFPDLGTDATINVKLPNADTVEGTPRLREYTLSVDDNYAYLKRTDSGMSATAARVENPAYQRGKDAIKLALTWNDQNDIGTVSKTTNGSKNSISFVVTASADIEYNSSTHKYKAISQGKIDGTARGDEGWKFSGTEAYDDGKDAVGLSIDTREAKVKLNKSSNATTEVQISQSLGTLNKATGSRTVSVKVGSVEDFLSNPLTDYKTGWNDAYDKNSVPGASTAYYMNAKWPGSTLSSGQISRQYTLMNDGNDNVKLQDNDGTVCAKFNHGKYTLGWGNAVDKRAIPGAGTAASFTAKWPNSTVGTGQDTKTYTVSDDTVNTVKISDGTNIVAKFTHNQYATGYSKGKTDLWDAVQYSYGGGTSYTVQSGTGANKVIRIPFTLTVSASGMTSKVDNNYWQTAPTAVWKDAYNEGFDADHDICLIGGKASSGGSAVIDSGFYHIEYNKTSGRKNIAQSWEAPSCWLDIVAYDDTQEVLGYDTTLALVKTWSTGRRDVVKKWNTPPNGYDEAARAMKYPSAISGQTTKATIYITHPKVGGGTEQYSLTLKKDSGGAYIMHNSVLLARVT